MPIATLLLREDSSTSLSALVERSQQKKSPSLDYDLQLNNCNLDLIQIAPTPKPLTSTSTDEGFESDIDTLSIVSSDDSFNSPENDSSKSPTETDSANGSASSDSDSENPPNSDTLTRKNVHELNNLKQESFNLVDCICYTDVKCPDILVFVIKQEAFVFKFANLKHLQNFYTNFTTLKAVTNQKTYGKNFEAKFNLLQRTDINGVTHIEITRDAASWSQATRSDEARLAKPKDSNSRQRTESKILQDDTKVDNLVNQQATLRKVWNSAESLLDAPTRPDRKKRQKPKAPLPPVASNDIFSGQYVRVNVNFDLNKNDKRLVIKSQCNEPHPKKLLPTKTNLTSFLKPKPQVLKYDKLETSTLNRKSRLSENSSWTNSVPRMLKKPRSRSETRNLTPPMAYRYIDTTQTYPVTYNVQPTTPRLTSNIHGFTTMDNIPAVFSSNGQIYSNSGSTQNFGNRLFGLSSKLREFNSKSGGDKWSSDGGVKENGNLKSVIKKDETRRKNDKKVTFSAYTTVQVV